MPTYDYECDACGHKFEHFQSIKDPLLRKCPQCKKSKLRRLFGTGAAVVFKGSGFYTTDYRSESYKKGATADKGESKSNSGESSTASSSSDSGNSDSGNKDAAATKTKGESSTTKSESSSAKSSSSKSKKKKDD